MRSILWRILPSALPTWARACGRCAAAALEPTSRFRVNSNGSVHDVWLLYTCPGCGWGEKRSLLRRVHERDVLLDPYRENDPSA